MSETVVSEKRGAHHCSFYGLCRLDLAGLVCYLACGCLDLARLPVNLAPNPMYLANLLFHFTKR